MVKSNFAKEELKAFIARVERLLEEKAALAADIRSVYDEASGTGFSSKIMRKVIKFRAMDKADFQEEDALTALYMDAVGFDSTPLGEAAGSAIASDLPPRETKVP